jgi:hypothetical protein
MQKIAIYSVPRSGSTWLGEILNSNPKVKYCYQPLFSYRYKDFLNESSSEQDIEKFFSLLYRTDDEFICQINTRNQGILPSFEKSNAISHTVYKEVRYNHIVENLLEKSADIKLIFLIRNPIEVINSWVNAPKEFNPIWNIEDQFFSGELKNMARKENNYGLDAWIKTTKKYEDLSRKFEDRVVLISYSMLKYNLRPTVELIYNFCDLKFSHSTSKFLKKSTSIEINDIYSVFRSGDKTKLTLSTRVIDMIIRHVSDAGLYHYIE